MLAAVVAWTDRKLQLGCSFQIDEIYLYIDDDPPIFYSRFFLLIILFNRYSSRSSICITLLMVCQMDATSNSEEVVRSSSTEPNNVSGPTTLPVMLVGNCASARQSPKVCVPPPSLLQRNSASPSVPRKIMSKNHNNTSLYYFLVRYQSVYLCQHY